MIVFWVIRIVFQFSGPVPDFSQEFSIQHTFKGRAIPGIYELPSGEAEVVESQLHNEYTSNKCILHVDTAQLEIDRVLNNFRG